MKLCDACNVAKAEYTVYSPKNVKDYLNLCVHHFKKCEEKLRQDYWIVLPHNKMIKDNCGND